LFQEIEGAKSTFALTLTLVEVSRTDAMYTVATRFYSIEVFVIEDSRAACNPIQSPWT